MISSALCFCRKTAGIAIHNENTTYSMQKTNLALLVGLAIITLSSCVKARVYRAELSARSAAEAREKILVQELLDL